MLSQMRKHAGSWMIKVMLFAIVVVFVFWGGSSMRSQKATVVAEVNGENITRDAFYSTFNQLVDNYRKKGDKQPDENALKKEALSQLVNRMIQLQEAEKLNISVSETEWDEHIRSMRVFHDKGVYDPKRVKWILSQNNLTYEQFKLYETEKIVLTKLVTIILSGVTITEDEAKAWYDWFNTKVSLEYALFPSDRYKDVKPTDAQLETFFDKNKDNYRTEPEVKVCYLFFDPNEYKNEIEISDEKVADYYQSNQKEFTTEKQVRARHILFSVGADADQKVVESKKAEALKVYQMAKSGKDFAGLARKYSEGPSKKVGGDLKFFTRKRMIKPFADQAFSMAVNEISEPLRTQYGWHIIKVEQVKEAYTQPLEKVSQGIRSKLILNKAKGKAYDAAEKIYNTVYDGDDLAEAGKEHEIPVKKTDFFTLRGPKEKGIIRIQHFAETAFGLDKMAISEIQDFGNGFYILQTVERKESVIPELAQVMDRVKADTVKDLQKEKAKADAETFLAEVKEAGSVFAEKSAAKNIKAVQTGLFSRNEPIPQLGYERQISQAAFKLTPESPLATQVLQGRKGWYVIRLKERKAPDDEGFDKVKETIVGMLTQQKQSVIYQNWLSDLRSKGKIDLKVELDKL